MPNLSVVALEKCFAYLATLRPALLQESNSRTGEAQAARCWSAAMASSMEGLANDAAVLKSLLQVKTFTKNDGLPDIYSNQLWSVLGHCAVMVVMMISDVLTLLPGSCSGNITMFFFYSNLIWNFVGY